MNAKIFCVLVLCGLAASQVSASSLRSNGRKLSGYCGWGCDNGRYKKWWSRWCTCNSGWEGRCCDVPSKCSKSSSTVCPQSKLEGKSAKCSALSANGPLRIGTAKDGLPPRMQGLYWLQNQGDSSALISFAQTSDGAGLSQLGDDGVFSVRVGGDRTWSFHDRATSWALVEAIDLVYHFHFDDAKKPTKAQIIPEARNLGGLQLTATWIMDFDMTFVDGPHEKYPNSNVWSRTSTILGQETPSADYLAVQVMDGAGNKLQPAFDEWVAYCGDASKTGGTPGEIHYHDAKD